MTTDATANLASDYDDFEMGPVVRRLIDEVKELYASDEIPWVVGYSGGKDSTAVAQLVWMAMSEMEPKERTKPVHIISVDTLVENPAVSVWVNRSLNQMNKMAKKSSMPIFAHTLSPDVSNSFWVNLIGKGYPAPRPGFRWCTDRLKIKPADTFIQNVVKENGEAILVLGTRKAESSARAGAMKKREENRKRDLLSPSTTLQNAYVYSPIAEWENDDVWIYLMQFENPWGYDNNDLLTMYRGATVDGECPLVVDTTTPSCGNSRFGCWVCTMVDEDKSMAAMIKNDDEKDWMTPLLDFRNNELKPAGPTKDHHKRDFRRLNGQISLKRPSAHTSEDSLVPGPYRQDVRADFLRKLLLVQKDLRQNDRAPAEIHDIDLITLDELQEIRRIWMIEKHEIEDLLPEIYESAVGKAFPSNPLDDRQPFDQEDMEILKELCNGDDLHFELVRELLDVERSFRSKAKRSNLFGRIEKAFQKSSYEGAEDATERAVRKRDFETVLDELRQGDMEFDEATTRVSEIGTLADLGDQS